MFAVRPVRPLPLTLIRYDAAPMDRMHHLAIAVFASFFVAPMASTDESLAAPDVERILTALPSPDSYGKHLLYLTQEPHMAGTGRNHALAAYVRDRFREYGLDE